MNRIFSNQKGGTLLCYVPDGAEAPKVAGICALLKVKYKELGSSELDRHIGYLLTGEEISEESRRVLERCNLGRMRSLSFCFAASVPRPSTPFLHSSGNRSSAHP